ncbi:MAG: Hsp20/alpha crystallin family protein [bacterium]
MSQFIKIRLFASHSGINNEMEKMLRHISIFNTPLAMINENIWHPPTDVSENKNEFIIVMEIAGMKKDDFEIAVSNDALTIAGHRRTASMDGKTPNNYNQMEIHSGYFEKIIYLPIEINTKKIKAIYQNGFLRIVLAKK